VDGDDCMNELNEFKEKQRTANHIIVEGFGGQTRQEILEGVVVM
jgi:hypothetical protein